MTNAGAMGEDRIVLPIPPGTHWSDAKPVVLPEGPAVGEEVKMLESEVGRLEKAVKEKGEGEGRGSRQGKGARDKKGGRGQGSGDREKGKGKAVPRVQLVQFGGLRFGTHAAAGAGQGSVDAARQDKDAAAELAKQLKLARKKLGQMKKKFDPVQEAFARELKDRWLEEVAARPGMLAPARAKYEVTRGAPGISPGSPGSPGSQGSQGSPEFILPGFAPSSEPCTSSLGSSAVA